MGAVSQINSGSQTPEFSFFDNSFMSDITTTIVTHFPSHQYTTPNTSEIMRAKRELDSRGWWRRIVGA